MSKLAMNWWKNLKGKVKRQELLKNHTSFRIGGPATLFIEPQDIADLKLLLDLLKRYKISTLLIGAGSNILVSDQGVKGAVLRLSAPYFKSINFKNNYCSVGAGVLLNNLVASAQKRDLAGLEFLVGIPGTVGGALVMNAGAQGKNIQDLIQNVTVMDGRGRIKTLNKKKIKFGYRYSSLSPYIVIGARLKLTPGRRTQIRKKIKEYWDYRKLTQDCTLPSAGCVFQNPPGHCAGKLIDLCGLKGKKLGGACISQKHANFILNLGDAQARDVLRLMDMIRKKVKHKFSITLKPEIKIWQTR